MRSRDVMTKNVVTVTPATTVKDAADLMAARGFTALPVLDADGDLIGVVTEADVVRGRFPHDPRYLCTDEAGAAQLNGPPREPAVTVGAIMTSPATVMTSGSDVVDLVATMETAGVRSIPIVDGTRLVGIVTRRDLVRTLARPDASIATDVRHQLEVYGGPGRWTVDVVGGAVTIRDAFDSDTDLHVATVLAEAVPGVVVVHVERQGVQ